VSTLPSRTRLDRWRRPPLVLAYHGVADVARNQDPGNMMVAPDRFRAQVSGLRARGYSFLKVSEFAARLEDGRGPPRCCALTFDDGTLDNLEVLPSLLSELDVPATVFVCPGLLGEPHSTISPGSQARLMSATEVVELAGLGSVEIGSHTRQHVDLGAATAAQALEEMTASKQSLEAVVGRPVSSFAYPGCAYSPACPEAAREAGYAVAVTCAPQGGWYPLELTRGERRPPRSPTHLRAQGQGHLRAAVCVTPGASCPAPDSPLAASGRPIARFAAAARRSRRRCGPASDHVVGEVAADRRESEAPLRLD
jgi:peptidoglycan/xylan/chitin deacetylase (PgdA/CDA1 family)